MQLGLLIIQSCIMAVPNLLSCHGTKEVSTSVLRHQHKPGGHRASLHSEDNIRPKTVALPQNTYTAPVAPCCLDHTVQQRASESSIDACDAGSHLVPTSSASTRPSGPPARRTPFSARQQSASTPDRACRGWGPSLTSCMLCVHTCMASFPLAPGSAHDVQVMHT